MLAGLALSIVFWSRLAKHDGRLLPVYVGAVLGAFFGAKLCYFLAEGWMKIGSEGYWLDLATGKTLLGALLGGYAGVECAKKAVGYEQPTGDWFALHRWGVQPDIMSFAKGITSGYLPLSGIIISDEIREAIFSAPPKERWMHAYTYSGHPTCCAVAVKNIEILEREGLVENAKLMGQRLLAGLQSLSELPIVGDVRGSGLMCAVEFVADRETKAPAGIGGKVQQACLDRGLVTRVNGDILMFAPPLVINAAEVDKILGIVHEVVGSL